MKLLWVVLWVGAGQGAGLGGSPPTLPPQLSPGGALPKDKQHQHAQTSVNQTAAQHHDASVGHGGAVYQYVHEERTEGTSREPPRNLQAEQTSNAFLPDKGDRRETGKQPVNSSKFKMNAKNIHCSNNKLKNYTEISPGETIHSKLYKSDVRGVYSMRKSPEASAAKFQGLDAGDILDSQHADKHVIASNTTYHRMIPELTLARNKTYFLNIVSGDAEAAPHKDMVYYGEQVSAKLSVQNQVKSEGGDTPLVSDGGPKKTSLPPPRQPPKTPPVSPADDESLPDLDDDDEEEGNSTELGMFLGATCEFTCNPKLHHVFCDSLTGRCECEKKYPVKLGPTKGCTKPVSLGEQCLYRQACRFSDPHASCVQISHNAICQCDVGYHSVSYSRPIKKTFCTEDLALLAADVHTLLGVCSGIALLAGLLCLVLHLYTRGRLPHGRPNHYADASLSPPMLYNGAGDYAAFQGIPMSLHTRPSSRTSQRSSSVRRSSPCPRASSGTGTSTHAGSRAGSRRPSLVSLQSSSSSVRSYSTRRFEREREQKEQRQQLRARMAQQRGAEPSPHTPCSTDGLLPNVCEGMELSLSHSAGMPECGSSSLEGILGPCSSSGTSY